MLLRYNLFIILVLRQGLKTQRQSCEVLEMCMVPFNDTIFGIEINKKI